MVGLSWNSLTYMDMSGRAFRMVETRTVRQGVLGTIAFQEESYLVITDQDGNVIMGTNTEYVGSRLNQFADGVIKIGNPHVGTCTIYPRGYVHPSPTQP